MNTRIYIRDYRFTFNGKESDSEWNNASGSIYDYGFRIYDPRIGKFLSVDPLVSKYPMLAPYIYCSNNPILFIDSDGRDIDLSNLSKTEKENYQANIKKLSASKIFNVYYNRLENSETVYYIKAGRGAGGSGSYNPVTNEIHSIDNMEVLSQEMFHAYQSDLGVYNGNDRSVRETEGDIVSSNIALSLGGLAQGNPWDQGIGFEYVDDNLVFNKSVLTKFFDEDFNNAVDARIEFYNSREAVEGAEAPKGYVQANSGVGAIALKKVVREANANKNGLEGPRLPNGDYYSK